MWLAQVVCGGAIGVCAATGVATTGLGTLPDPPGGFRTLVEGSATPLVRVAIEQGTVAGGILEYCVRASDAAAHLQLRCGVVPWSAANQGGLEMCSCGSASDVTPGGMTGTLLVGCSCSSNADDTVDIALSVDSSLAGAVVEAGWRLRRNYGTGAVTPQ